MTGTEILVDHTRYIMRPRNDAKGGFQICRIAPYDETDYHWALARAPGVWTIYRQGQATGQVISEDPEEVAEACKQRDEACNLRRTGGIW